MSRIQDADVKTLAQVGSTASRLINDTKIYVSANSINKQLSQAITDGDIGGGGAFTTYANENITGGSAVTIVNNKYFQYRRITGNAGAVTASSTPFSLTAADGTVIRLVGQSNTNTVTFTNNDAAGGMILNGSATLGQYDILEVQYDSTAGRYIETGRNF